MSMELKDVFQIMHEFDCSASSSLELCIGGDSLKLKKDEAVSDAQQYQTGKTSAQSSEKNKTEENAAMHAIRSPLVGIFYAADGEGKEPFVKAGSHVKKGDTLCMIEAMKMMSNVKAEKDCIILEVLVKDKDTVDYDRPLFRIEDV